MKKATKFIQVVRDLCKIAAKGSFCGGFNLDFAMPIISYQRLNCRYSKPLSVKILQF